MPEASLTTFSLQDASPSELEQRRRNIVARYTDGASVDDMTIEDLRELAAITSALRRRTTTAPKSGKKAGTAKRPKNASTIDDVFNQL